VGVRSEEAWARGQVDREGESTLDVASANNGLLARQRDGFLCPASLCWASGQGVLIDCTVPGPG
jgi:hypothetical protein